jgi:hypothetical protein
MPDRPRSSSPVQTLVGRRNFLPVTAPPMCYALPASIAEPSYSRHKPCGSLYRHQLAPRDAAPAPPLPAAASIFLPTARDILLKSFLAQDPAELHSRLSMSGTSALQEFYRSAPFTCRIGPGHFPSAKAMQLVAALEAAQEVSERQRMEQSVRSSKQLFQSSGTRPAVRPVA